ncbi:hypothetical protein B0T11DRAFT_113750 [Plectosphaerella cucumerina]|uniref:Zn(2)-C6 fungal-type domain-containing protein n=1 Tax=Plectosphaerella cucumerina TaxID=40658 RepID=A0A8K0TIZ0_9PEZI|nr:hypothetical protein B0T11DRAFT_113750 [Plectosphaerella cucumerina]
MSPASPPRRRPMPCNPCRQRHWKCSTDRTPCPNCQTEGLDCVRRCRIRFSHALNPSVGSGNKSTDADRSSAAKRRHTFSESQPWVRTDRAALSFVDETKSIASLDEYTVGEAGERRDFEGTAVDSPLCEGDSSPSPAHSPGYASSPASTHSSSLPRTSLVSQDAAKPDDDAPTRDHRLEPSSMTEPLTPSSSVPVDLMLEGDPGFDKTLNPALPDLFGLGLADGSSPGFDASISLLSPHELALVNGEAGTIYLDAPRWPLDDPEEAMLFRYYIDHLTPFLDMCDEERHFARIVPLRAATCCPLFHAILAYAAKRLSRLNNYESLVADNYHQKCLNALIPALSHSSAAVDENLLTSLILLRAMEELDVPISTPSPEYHLMGTRMFLEAQKTSCDFKGLRLASFWVALRQEIYMAFIHGRPVHSDFALNNFDWLGKPDVTGCNVANRIIIYCAACLRYCYGPQELTVSAWDELQGYLQEWWDERPWYYSPLYSNRADDSGLTSFLPNEPYYNSAVVTGIQHYYLAKMLLAAHSPKIPRLGPSRRAAFNAMNDEIKNIVRVIAGIAESNEHTLPAYVPASMAITMAGDRFTERGEQEILYGLLIKTDRELAWPTHSARQALRESWGWDDSAAGHSGASIDTPPMAIR